MLHGLRYFLILSWSSLNLYGACPKVFGQLSGHLAGNLKEAVKEPLKISGSINIHGRSYQAWGILGRQSPLSGHIFGTLTLQKGHFSLPLNLLFAQNTLAEIQTLGSDSPNLMMFRVGASPAYKWAKVHLGHRNMHFSKYSLNKHNFFGAGMELRPGRLRIDGMAGSMVNARPQNLSVRQPFLPRYERSGWGTKLGYGTEQSFFDVFLFKAGEDSTSIPLLEVGGQKVNPNENLVLGFVSQIQVIKNLLIELEYGRSAFTGDTRDPVFQTGGPLYNSSLFRSRTSTQISNAINAGLHYSIKKLTLRLQYERIDPGYRTLGSWFFNQDIQNYLLHSSLSPTIKKGNLFLSGSLGLQTDNLDNKRAYQNSRVIGNLNLNYMFKGFRLNSHFNNYSVRLDYILSEDLDSLKVVAIARDIGLQSSYDLGGRGPGRKRISASVNLQSVSDNLQDLNQPILSRLVSLGLGFHHQFPKDQWSYHARIRYLKVAFSQQAYNRFSSSAGVQKTFWDRKLSTGFNSTFFIRIPRQGSTNLALNINGNASYKLGSDLGLSLSVGTILQQNQEMFAQVGLSYSFSKAPQPRNNPLSQ